MPETFTPKSWADGSAGGTPIIAAELNRVEQGIESMDDRTTALEAAASVIEANTQTGTTYTFALSDAGRCVEGNNAAAITFTIPPNASVAFPAGTVVEVYQAGTGQITVAPGAGVTLRAPDGAKLAKQYASASLRQRTVDEWVLAGSVSP